MLAHLKLRRAHEVAHVLHPEQIEAGRIEPLLQQGQASTHHRGIQMAGTTRGDGHHRHTHGLEALGIELGGHVTFQHRHLELRGEGGDGLLEQGGFAGTRAAHHIETEQLPGIEMGTVVLGLVLVGSQEVEPERVL